MNAGYFEVNTSVLNRDAEEVGQLISDLSNRLKEMVSSVQSLSGSWEGAAKMAFLEQVQKDAVFFSEYLAELSDFQNSLQTASKEYDTCEEQVMDLVRSINI